MTVVPHGALSAEQYDYLLNPIKSTRIASRRVGGKNLSYLEAWDVKAHLTRIFGFGNWDLESLREELVGIYPYMSGGDNPKEMVEVAWKVTMRLVVRDAEGTELARHSESAVGSAYVSKGASGIGDAHDNAIKQASSDAAKRCAINWGTQFGLSLYNDGQKTDVIRHTLVTPSGYKTAEGDGEGQQRLDEALGGQQVEPSGDRTNEGQSDDDVAHEQRQAAEEAAGMPSSQEGS